jgi:hypothetical protein
MVAGLGQLSRLFGELRCPLIVTGLVEREREHRPRQGGLDWFRCVVGERKRQFARLDRPVEVELLHGEEAEPRQQVDQQVDRRAVRGSRERELEVLAALGDALGDREVHAQGPATRDRNAWVWRVARVGEGHPEVFVVELETPEPVHAVPTAQLEPGRPRWFRSGASPLSAVILGVGQGILGVLLLVLESLIH